MHKLLTADEVSKLLALSRATVYRLAEQGILPVVVVAKRSRKTILRFRPETVERFIRDRELPTKTTKGPRRINPSVQPPNHVSDSESASAQGKTTRLTST